MSNKQIKNSCVDFFECFEIFPFHCPTLYYPSINAWVFQVVSFTRVSSPKSCMCVSFPPCVPSAPLIHSWFGYQIKIYIIASLPLGEIQVRLWMFWCWNVLLTTRFFYVINIIPINILNCVHCRYVVTIYVVLYLLLLQAVYIIWTVEFQIWVAGSTSITISVIHYFFIFAHVCLFYAFHS